MSLNLQRSTLSRKCKEVSNQEIRMVLRKTFWKIQPQRLFISEQNCSDTRDTSNAGKRGKLHIPVKVSWGFSTRRPMSLQTVHSCGDASQCAEPHLQPVRSGLGGMFGKGVDRFK